MIKSRSDLIVSFIGYYPVMVLLGVLGITEDYSAFATSAVVSFIILLMIFIIAEIERKVEDETKRGKK